MVRTRHHTAAVHGVLLGSVLEHPMVWEFVGDKKYLQMAVSKAVARAYVAKFSAVTSKYQSRIAAKDGDLSLLVWAKEVGCDWSPDVFLAAVEGGQTTIMQFLLDNQCPIPTGTDAFDVAARSFSVQTLEYLYEKRFQWDEDVCAGAAYVGWLEGLQWLRAHDAPWDDLTRKFCADAGRLAVYQWAHQQGCPGSHEAIAHNAAHNGQLEFLKWLKEDGCALDDPHICATAALGNRLPTLQWLRANNAPWDYTTTLYARRAGHREVEIWALDNGCPEPTPEDLAPPAYYVSDGDFSDDEFDVELINVDV